MEITRSSLIARFGALPFLFCSSFVTASSDEPVALGEIASQHQVRLLAPEALFADSVIHPELRSKTELEIERENELFFGDLFGGDESPGQRESTLDLSAGELLGLSQEVARPGLDVLRENPHFSRFFQMPSFSPIAGKHDLHEHVHDDSCATIAGFISICASREQKSI